MYVYQTNWTFYSLNKRLNKQNLQKKIPNNGGKIHISPINLTKDYIVNFVPRSHEKQRLYLTKPLFLYHFSYSMKTQSSYSHARSHGLPNAISPHEIIRFVQLHVQFSLSPLFRPYDSLV